MPEALDEWFAGDPPLAEADPFGAEVSAGRVSAEEGGGLEVVADGVADGCEDEDEECASGDPPAGASGEAWEAEAEGGGFEAEAGGCELDEEGCSAEPPAFEPGG